MSLSMFLKITLSHVLRSSDTSNHTDQLSILLELRRSHRTHIQNKFLIFQNEKVVFSSKN